MFMIHKHLLLCCSLLILFSCNNNRENSSAKDSATATKDTIAPVQVTVLADLPDSLQPKTIALDTMPKPLTIFVPAKEGGSYKVEEFNGLKEYQLKPPEVTFFLDSLTKLPIAPEAQGTGAFTTFNTENGLVLDHLTCSLMDSSGVLWFGTEGGVSRYDGKNFTSYTTAQGLLNNGVWSICQDRSGILWFGTGNGVSSYDGTRFTSFSKAKGFNTGVRSILLDRSGIFWFGTSAGGIVRYDPAMSGTTGKSGQASGKEFTNFSTAQGLAGNLVRCIVQDDSGILWFGTDKGLSRYDPRLPDGQGKAFTTFNTSNGLGSNVILSMLVDKSGTLWIGTSGGGVSRYDTRQPDGQGKTFATLTKADGLSSNTIRCIFLDNEGNLWFGTDNGGASCYNGKSFANFSRKEGLVSQHVRSILQDRSGSFWFGTYISGVSRYDGKAFTSFPVKIRTILQDSSGNLLFGSGKGVSRYDGKSLTQFTASQGGPNNSVFCSLLDRNGNFWFGTGGDGAFRFDARPNDQAGQGKSFTRYGTAQGLAGNFVWRMLEDRSGNIWFGTDGGGVSRYDARLNDGAGKGKSFTNFSTEQGLANFSIRTMQEDDHGNIWFGTDDGVSIYDGKKFITITTAQGLASNEIMSSAEDMSGNIWFGTVAGLSVISKAQQAAFLENVNRGEKITKPLFENYNVDDGLDDNSITQIFFDDTNRIYIGTSKGICELLRNTGNSSMKKEWRVGNIFDVAHGYPMKEVMQLQPSVFKDKNGIIWIATNSEKTRLVRFDQHALPKTPVPALVINAIKINGANVCWNDLKLPVLPDTAKKDSAMTPANITEEATTFGKVLHDSDRITMRDKFRGITFDGITPWYFLPENLVLNHDNNNISFDFIGIETARNFLMKYQYKLEGLDDDWSAVSNSTTANFGNLYEGTYTFKVKAQNADGIWGDTVSYDFKVLPPWWRTWWAYSIYTLLFLLALRAFIKWQERKLIMENEKLERIVEIRTAEVVAEKKEVEKQKKRSDDLLLNILPEEVAEELKAKGSADAKQFDEVTVLFTDFKNFTGVAENLSAQDLVNEINYCYSEFDKIISKHGVEKIKTIGDAYMCAGGLPVASKTNAEDTVKVALEIREFMLKEKQIREAEGRKFFEIRIGLHTGPVVAGIVGIKKFAYDIWGDTVNIASRMESSGEAGKVNISGATHELVKDQFTCVFRGKIPAKNKGEIEMYFVEA